MDKRWGLMSAYDVIEITCGVLLANTIVYGIKLYAKNQRRKK